MRLATWRADGEDAFGAVLEGRVVALGGAGGMDTYLAGLPGSRDEVAAVMARPPVARGRESRPLDSVRLLAPLPRPAAVLDCGLTPRHLANSSAVLLRRSLPRVLGTPAGAAARRLLRSAGRGPVRYYKGNPTSVSGPGETIPWPPFTAYPDIEPELAVVTGDVPLGADRATARAAVAGYTIFNDWSARDVQLAEMLFTGPASCKDLDHGNGLGPWLVTPDELDDPRDLEVRVTTTGRPDWHGHTREYSMDPLDVVVALAGRQSLHAGTVVGLGTVPGTCGLDRDEWLEPGDEVAITVEGIGTLRQRLGVPARMPRTRWSPR